jgi:hypothetical protein
VSRPDVLYHGSSVLVPVLEPNKGFVYAAHDRTIAIVFALAFGPDESGRCQWHFNADPADPRISIEHGWLDTAGVGYVYRVPADRFEECGWQWVSRVPVTPLGYEIIRSADYIGWIAKNETR